MSRFKIVALCVAMILIMVLAGTALAQEKIRLSCKFTSATVKREVIEIGDVKGHYAVLREYEGNFVVTGGPKMMDGALVNGFSFSDMIEGGGSIQGYGKVVKGPDSFVYKYERGQRHPSTLPDGSPTMKWEVTLAIIKGTGELEGIRGGATLKGTYISKNIAVSEGEVEYWIEK
jgi:hypothetical protein